MADRLRKVDYFYVMVPNTAGQGSKVLAGLGAEGVNLLNSSEPVAWQTVFHFHLHVIPRFDDEPLADQGVVQERIAESRMLIEQSRWMVLNAAYNDAAGVTAKF